MKSILYSVYIGTLALALATGGAQAATDNNKQAQRAQPQKRSANAQAARPANTGRSMNMSANAHRNVSAAQYRQQRSYANVKPRTSSNFVANRNARLQSMRERNFARNQAFRERTNAAFNRNTNGAVNRSRDTAELRARNNSAVNRDRNVTVNRNRNSEVNREQNVAVNRTRNTDVNRFRNTNEFGNRNNVAINRERNFNHTQNAAFYRGSDVRVTNNWRGEVFRGQRYAAFRNYNRQWHDRSWWRNHYTRIVFVNNGWWVLERRLLVPGMGLCAVSEFCVRRPDLRLQRIVA